jgi:spermidine synthase
VKNLLPIRLVVNLIFLGVCGIVAQAVLLRELLVLFSGNELTIGVIIGAWVLFEAIGAMLAGFLAKRERSIVPIFTLFSILFIIAFPISIWLARSYKYLARIPPELGVGVATTIVASSLVMLPVGVLHGILFIAGAILFKRESSDPATATGKAYAWETIGTLLGGIVVSYIFITMLEPFRTAFLVAILTLFACLVLPDQGRFPRLLLVGALAIVPLLYLSTIPHRLQQWSIGRQWQGKEVVASRNSLYQNLTVTRSSDEFTFFSDGQPILTTPLPDITAVEELTHIPLLAHPAPRSVLLLAGGAGGVIAEILKHPSITRVDYLEIDPLMIRLLKEFPSPLTTGELSDPRVRVIVKDPRPFLRETKERYDLVIINQGIPQTLLANRLFTRECFLSIKGRLNEGGVLTFPWSGSSTYYNQELKELNSSLKATMAGVFPSATIIPGDTNLVVAGIGNTITLDPNILARRLAERKIQARLITPQHLTYRLDPIQIRWLEEEMAWVKTGINLDLAPKGLHYAMSYRNLIFSPWLNSILARLSAIPQAAWGSGVIILFAIAWGISVRFPTLPVTAAIGATGMAAMLMELFIIFAFQVAFGQIYHAAALLLISLMGGLAGGSLLMTALLPKIENEKRLFVSIEAGVAIFALLLALLFFTFGKSGATDFSGLYTLYPAMLVLAGFLAGLQFPLAIRIHARCSNMTTDENISLGHGAGIIYGADLMGACVGGVAGGFLILPLCGLVYGALLVALLKLATMILMVRT